VRLLGQLCPYRCVQIDDTAIVKALSKYYRALEALQSTISTAQEAAAAADTAADPSSRRFKHGKSARKEAEKAVEKTKEAAARSFEIDEASLSMHREQITTMQRKLLMLLIGGPLA
jgi:predicted  nucleic acid-binding Zn-ribbon protein